MKVILIGYVYIWGQDGVKTTGDVQSFFLRKESFVDKNTK